MFNVKNKSQLKIFIFFNIIVLFLTFKALALDRFKDKDKGNKE